MDFIIRLIQASLFLLSLGAVTSISVLAGFHIFILVPGLYLFKSLNFKKLPLSFWALLSLLVFILASVVFNQDIIVQGYRGFFKAKYFVFGLLSIAPISFYFLKTDKDKNQKFIRVLLHTILISTTLATCWGFYRFIATKLGLVDISTEARYSVAGTFGMVLNYAHNLSFFIIFVLGCIINYEKIKNLVSKKLLLAVLFINSLGMFFSYSRGAWLAVLISTPFFLLKKSLKLFVCLLISAVISLSLLYLLAGDAMKRVDGDQTRIGQWQGAVKAFQERPVLGVGYLNYEQICDQIKRKYDLVIPDFKGHAHNNFFEILATTGLLGFISFLIWLFSWIKEMYFRDDIIANITLPLIFCFIIGGLTQSTIALGINLFIIMGIYSISQARQEILKS